MQITFLASMEEIHDKLRLERKHGGTGAFQVRESAVLESSTVFYAHECYE